MRILVIPHASWESGSTGLKCPIEGVTVVVNRNLDLIDGSAHVLYLNTGEYEPGLLNEMGARARAARIEHGIVTDERDLPRRIENAARTLTGLPLQDDAAQHSGWANDALAV